MSPDSLTDRAAASALLLVLLTVPFFCPSCRQKTEVDEVLETVDSLARLAEKRDLQAIMAQFAEDFADFEGRDRKGIRSLLSTYFAGRTGIVVHRLSQRVSDFSGRRATVETEVALSSGGAQALRRLVRISPDIYQVRLDLARVGEDWLVGYAEWAPVGLTDLLPESLARLKKIFPMI